MDCNWWLRLTCSAMRILVADDHESIRRGMRALLETQDGWKVCGEAENGQEAVEKAKALRPDIVIMDISMPVLSGFGAARLIKEHLPEVPILAYSMYRSEAFQEEARRIGLGGYVAKSEDGPTLLMAVDAVQNHRAFFAA